MWGLYTLILSTLFIVASAQDNSSQCVINGYTYPDANSCKHYYRIQNGVSVRMRCPIGLVWNCFTNTCARIRYSQCCPYDSISIFWHKSIYCPFNGIRFPCFFNCNKYYECQNNRIKVFYCGKGKKFDWITSRCKDADWTCAPCGPNITTSTTKPPVTKPSTNPVTIPPSPLTKPATIPVTIPPNPLTKPPTTPSKNSPITVIPPLPRCTPNGIRFPSVSNCSKYYECINNVLVGKYCPVGTRYGWFSGRCRVGGICYTVRTTSPPSTTTPTKPITPTTPTAPPLSSTTTTTPTTPTAPPATPTLTTTTSTTPSPPTPTSTTTTSTITTPSPPTPQPSTPTTTTSTTITPPNVTSTTTTSTTGTPPTTTSTTTTPITPGPTPSTPTPPPPSLPTTTTSTFTPPVTPITTTTTSTTLTLPTTTSTTSTSTITPPTSPTPQPSTPTTTTSTTITPPNITSTTTTGTPPTTTPTTPGPPNTTPTTTTPVFVPPSTTTTTTSTTTTTTKLNTLTPSTTTSTTSPNTTTTSPTTTTSSTTTSTTPASTTTTSTTISATPTTTPTTTTSPNQQPPLTSSTSPPPFTLPPITTTPAPHCPNKSIAIPNTGDCQSYFKCFRGKLRKYYCPPDQYWNCFRSQCELTDTYVPCCKHDPYPPTNNDVCYEEGKKIPSPVNRRVYFECVNSHIVRKRCARGEEFDWIQKICRSPAICAPYIIEEPANTTTTSTSTTTTIPTTNTCPTNNTIPDGSDCSSYYICIDNVITKQKCPQNQYYNCWTKECSTTKSPLCCSNITTSELLPRDCPVNNEKNPLPDQCTNYLQCNDNEVVKRYCGPYQVFDAWTKKCISPIQGRCGIKPRVTVCSIAVTGTLPIGAINFDSKVGCRVQLGKR